MNDIRRTILWVVFGFSMVLLWDQWQVHTGHKATFFPAPATTAAEPKAVMVAERRWDARPMGRAETTPVPRSATKLRATMPWVGRPPMTSA